MDENMLQQQRTIHRYYVFTIFSQGGDGGALWEDGVFDSVRKIYVGQGDIGISFLKFVYKEDTKLVSTGDDHGSKKLLDVKEVINYLIYSIFCLCGFAVKATFVTL